MKKMRFLCQSGLLFCLFFCLYCGLSAQVTTSAMSGLIVSSHGAIEDVYVRVQHQPTGTIWETTTNQKGRFYLQGLLTGGPYSVTLSHLSHQTQQWNDIVIPLGETYVLNVTLVEEAKELGAIDVIDSKSEHLDKSGISMHFSTNDIAYTSNVSRSLEEMISHSPLLGINNSFAGTDGRYNNILVDGSSFKNGYGLSSKLTTGGDYAEPFSLDALEALSVSVAPFDIRQSNFTGANINLTTRRGTNNFSGSAFYSFRPKALTGNLVGDNVITNANNINKQVYGFRLQGPIVKNRLFFFVNAEYERSSITGNEWRPSIDGIESVQRYISRTTVNDLEQMSQFLMQKWGYDAGGYQNNNPLNQHNIKILGRIDWNINHKNKLSVRYNEVQSESEKMVNLKSTPLGNLSSERYSAMAYAFSNTNFRFVDISRSISGEWNSYFSKYFYNQLLIDYSYTRSFRTSQSALFPFVDIFKDGKPYMSFGYEPFSHGTDMKNNVLGITNHLFAYLGNHSLLAGISFRYMGYANNYLQYGLGYYRFDSLEAFYSGAPASLFGLTYGYDESDPMFSIDFGLGAFYLQDEWNVNQQLKFSFGLRFERPFFLNKIKDNPAINALTFQDNYHFNIGSWSNPQWSISPRVGFRWDVPTEKANLVLRGGTGIFTGLVPFVWFNEQPSLSGVVQNTVINTDGIVPFVTDYQTLFSNNTLFPQQADGVVPNSFVEIDKNFRMPQAWRTHLAFDWKLPAHLVFTVEMLYSRDIQAVVQKNVNEKSAQGHFAGSDQRDSWWDADGKPDNQINPQVKYAMVLKNMQQGYHYSITAQLEKKMSHGFSGFLAYTYNLTKNLSDNTGTSAKSRFVNNVSVNSLNDLTLSHSGYSVPHRVVGSLCYHLDTKNHLAFTVSLNYQGSAQARYSYIYSNDMNGDGNVSDLIYIPKSREELLFKDMEKATATEQQAAFWDFVQSNNYLNKHQGEYAERNGSIGPWVHRFNLRLLQDLYTNFGTQHRYTLQLSLDVLNIANLLNPKWGCYKIHGFGNSDNTNIALLKYVGTNEQNIPTYQLNSADINAFSENARWFNKVSTNSTWGCLLGLRLLF